MNVYVVKAGEWESEARYVCATEDIAKAKCKEIADEYGLEEGEYDNSMIYFQKMELIEKL